MITIETEKLILRSYKDGDEKEILNLIRNNQVHLKKVLDGWELNLSNVSDATEFIKKYSIGWSLKKIYTFGIWYKPIKKLVGQIILFHINWSSKEAEIGSFIAKNMQGKGITTEAKSEVMKFAFHNLNINKIIANCHKNNVATHRVNQKCGFSMLEKTGDMIKFVVDKQVFFEHNIND